MPSKGERSKWSAGLVAGRAGRAESIETLEPRLLLSAALPEGTRLVDWGAARVPAIQGSWIVTFDDLLGEQQAEVKAQEVATRLGVNAVGFRAIGRGGFAEFMTDGAITKATAQAVAESMAGVRAIEPNLLYQIARTPNDQNYGQQYGLENVGQIVQGVPGVAGADIGATRAWDRTIGSRNVVIAVIDSGLDVTHPDLIPNLWINPGEVANDGIDNDGNGFVDDINGYDFGELRGQLSDLVGHGTNVAGVIGAAGNNGIGVTGVAWTVSIMGLKIANRFGQLSAAAIIGAHDYATAMRPRLAALGFDLAASNNSYGLFAPEFYEDFDEGLQAERAAIERFIASGGVFVAAAGNNGADNDGTFTSFPASYNIPGVISVAATNNQDALAGFSNFGVQNVDIAAPGVNILTTAVGGTYSYVSGTSFASPMVAGAVALLRAAKPNASAVEIREALSNSSDPLPTLQNRVRSGGRLNIDRALQIIGQDGPVLRSVSPGPVTGQLDSATNQPVNSLRLEFSKDINASLLTTSAVLVRGDGADNTFDTGDDVLVTVSNVTRNGVNPRVVDVTLNLNLFPGARLPIDRYRVTLVNTAFQDTLGNRLNGTTTTGTDATYVFQVVSPAGVNEPNDTLAQATPVSFDASGRANFVSQRVGDGIQGLLDVDLYRVNMARGGQISAEIFARRLSQVSTLDSYLRLFNALGQEIASNDNTIQTDSFIDFFVPTGGTYYIGVSGFGNPSYNPAVAGSGATQSTGVYDLRLAINLAQDDVVTVTSAADTSLPRRVPVAENQTQGTTTAQIVVTDSREILDVNVRVNISHTFVSDLRISLISPLGTEVLLFDRRGSSGQNLVNTVFDDDTAAGIAGAAAPFTGSFRPEQALGLFDGQRANGAWTLRVVDTLPTNSGFLNSWSLEFTFQNNIFGPFEANDTIATARPLPGVAGTGSTTLQAFLGDGAFGTFDRDIYRFTADAGSTLTAVATPTGGLNTAMRLFDSLGNEVLLSNPGTSLLSRIENYVFAAAGTYYLAVSEANNTVYNPTVVGDATGRPALTTGGYALNVTVAAGVSDPATVLAGTRVNVGVNAGGNFAAPDASGQNVGLRFGGREFLPSNPASPIRPQAFFGGIVDGFGFRNSSSSAAEVPFALTASSDTYNNRMSAEALFRGLRVERSFSFGVNDAFIAIDIYLTNTTTSVLTGLAWMEGFNPDHGLALGASRSTANDIAAGGRLATASVSNNDFQGGLTVGLGAAIGETRATANVISSDVTVRDPQVLLGLPVNDPNGASSDAQLSLAFNVGDVGAGQTRALRYFIFFGNSLAEVNATYAQLNAGTGTGHLAADPAAPATEALADGTLVPTLPYRLFYPEGFFGDNIFTFVPVSNPNDQPARVVLIARYEATPLAQRDQVLATFNVPANSRGGVTITTPELFRSGQALTTRQAPYAVELRADRPVSAVFSHYDLGLLGGVRASVGEAFTTRVDTSWSFPSITKGEGQVQFILFYNTTSVVNKVTGRFLPVDGNPAISATFTLDAFRRGGFSINDLAYDAAYTIRNAVTLSENYLVTVSSGTTLTTINGQQIVPGTVIPAGTVINAGSTIAAGNTLLPGKYGAVLTADAPIVASLSLYDTVNRSAEGIVGNAGLGSTVGVLPAGEIGVNSTNESISIVNGNTTAASVTLSFLFANGSAYRTAVDVPANGARRVDVQSLPNFPRGQAYGVFFESNVSVSVATISQAFNDAIASSSADRGYTLWGFGEGFRPGDNSGHPGLVEFLRLYNPSATPITVEITISYDGVPGNETFRRTLNPRRLTEFDVDQFITGERRASNQWFGLTIKSPTPIVAYMTHWDKAFPGAFGTLGTPLGLSAPVT